MARRRKEPAGDGRSAYGGNSSYEAGPRKGSVREAVRPPDNDSRDIRGVFQRGQMATIRGSRRRCSLADSCTTRPPRPAPRGGRQAKPPVLDECSRSCSTSTYSGPEASVVSGRTQRNASVWGIRPDGGGFVGTEVNRESRALRIRQELSTR